MKFWNGMGAAAAAIGLSLVAAGQTCTTVPTSVTALNIERVLPLANVLTTITPNANPATLAALAGGALEIREVLIYNPQTSNLTSTVFLVPAGTPSPTPAGGITAANTAMVTITTVGPVLASCTPVPALIFTGTVTGSIGTLYAPSLVGAVSSLALGYTTDSPAKINNVAETIAGVVTAYSAAATGTLVVPVAPTPPGGGGTGPTIVVKFANGSIALPSATTQAPFSPFFLDASGSTSSGGALTFVWSTVSNSSPVAFVGTGIPGQILVQFPGTGSYVIQLKVTDAAGGSSTFTLVLEFTGRPQ
jgi:hypothetical protein